MLSKRPNAEQRTNSTLVAALVWVVAWAWTILAAGGGVWLLWTRGPWRLSNGWFALFSGLSACPAIPWFLRKYAGVTISGYVQIAAAAFFFVAGRIALLLRW